jgi:uncharacterized protein (DUF697 family)
MASAARSRKTKASNPDPYDPLNPDLVPNNTWPPTHGLTIPPAALVIVAKHAKYAALLGLVPVPLLDFGAILAVQLNMVDQICQYYGQPFKKHILMATVLSMIGSSIPTFAISSAARLVPWIGAIGAIAFTPAVAATTTYAVGRTFVDYYASGGTITTLPLSWFTATYKRYKAEEDAAAAAVAAEEAAAA